MAYPKPINVCEKNLYAPSGAILIDNRVYGCSSTTSDHQVEGSSPPGIANFFNKLPNQNFSATVSTIRYEHTSRRGAGGDDDLGFLGGLSWILF